MIFATKRAGAESEACRNNQLCPRLKKQRTDGTGECTCAIIVSRREGEEIARGSLRVVDPMRLFALRGCLDGDCRAGTWPTACPPSHPTTV